MYLTGLFEFGTMTRMLSFGKIQLSLDGYGISTLEAVIAL